MKNESFIKWRERVSSVDRPFGMWTVRAILPHMQNWFRRRKGVYSTFYSTQLMTGHGCFNAFLYKIKKRDTPACDFCGDPEDTAHHTLVSCPAWREEREELRGVLDIANLNLELASIVEGALRDRDIWRSFITFCHKVMKKKEHAEREKQQNCQQPPLPP